MSITRQDLRRWIDARRAAEQREIEERAGCVPSPAESLERALRLIRLAGSIHGWPLPSDRVSAREDARAYERWARLRTRLARA